MDTDFFLGFLTSLAEGEDGFNVPITLNVGGVIVSGELISEDEYFAGLSQLFTDHEGEVPEGATTWKEVFRSLPSLFDSFAMEQLDDGADPQETQEMRESLREPYVHLRNTQVWTAEERFFGFEGAFWRGKLSSIDGFWFGQAATQE